MRVGQKPEDRASREEFDKSVGSAKMTTGSSSTPTSFQPISKTNPFPASDTNQCSGVAPTCDGVFL